MINDPIILRGDADRFMPNKNIVPIHKVAINVIKISWDALLRGNSQ